MDYSQQMVISEIIHDKFFKVLYMGRMLILRGKWMGLNLEQGIMSLFPLKNIT